jgi:hypothetical protein
MVMLLMLITAVTFSIIQIYLDLHLFNSINKISKLFETYGMTINFDHTLILWNFRINIAFLIFISIMGLLYWLSKLYLKGKAI